jgi:N-acetylglucosamine malate deacetylase 1
MRDDSHLDLLAFGAHPDDIEIGLGGTVAKHVALGHRVGLCDLTRGEAGSNGTPEERMAEAERARAVLGAEWRDTAGLPDRALGASAGHVIVIVEIIRRHRPRLVLAPHWEDRHPDHVAASRMVADAVFSAGLRRYPASGDAWRPEQVCYYFVNGLVDPSFVVDVSAHYEVKRRALACHQTQFRPSAEGAVETRLTSPRFMQLIESRDAWFGSQVGVAFAEGFVVKEPLTRIHLLDGA